MRVEEQYMDVLQNLEHIVVSAFRRQPEMSDAAVMRAYEALIDSYVAEKIGRMPRDLGLSPLEVELKESLRGICEWRQGKNVLGEDGADSKTKVKGPEPYLTVDEMLLCLKRLRKSCEKWTREGGRQGYVQFISRFV